MIKWLLLVLSIMLISIGHYQRMQRWKLSVKIYERPQDDQLLKALAYGYLLNFFLPFRIGDFFRAVYAGRKMKNSYSFSFITVVIDRYLDVITVGLIFILLSLSKQKEILQSAVTYIFLSIIMILLTIFIFTGSKYVKRITRKFAAIFNSNIEYKILNFVWSGIQGFKDLFLHVNRKELLLRTITMWGAYLGSYYCFAEFLISSERMVKWTDIFLMFFCTNSLKMNTGKLSFGNISNIIWQFKVEMFLYAIVPLGVLLFGAGIYKYLHQIKERSEISVDEKGKEINLLPQIEKRERVQFLEDYFSNNKREFLERYIEISRTITIIRDYSAGSNASTMLCTDGDQTFFRKYAFGKDADKLQEQIEWIETHDYLPLPLITRKEKDSLSCFYDMPYYKGTVSMFQYIHMVSINESWAMLQNVLECMQKNLYEGYKTDSMVSTETIERYIDEKVEKNLHIILNSKKLGKIVHFDTIRIDGVIYHNIQHFLPLLKKEHLLEVFSEDKVTDVHGDLTVENIIVTQSKECADSFYIIDPNSGNIHNTALLDYAKLLQSLHGGYEFLMSGRSVEVKDNRINFLCTRSKLYIELYNKYREWLLNTYGESTVRSIYYHEIVHWLRLMPYKIENLEREECITFYAGLLLILDDLEKLYGDL